MSLCECSNRRFRCRRQWVASSRRHWFYSVATAVTRSQWSRFSMGIDRLMVRRDGGGGFRLGPASLDGLWGRQGQRMQTACVGKVDCGPGLRVGCMDRQHRAGMRADYGRRGGCGRGRRCGGCRFPELHRVAGRQIDVFSVGSATRRALSGGGAVDGLLDYCPAGPRQPVGGLWATRVMLRGHSWPSVRASELGWGVGGGRACVNNAGPGYSTCRLGSRRPAGARMGHCAQIGWAWEGGMA